MQNVHLSGFPSHIIGEGHPLAVIAGPCVIESLDLCREVGAEAKAVCDELGLPYIFKASFDKANRTSSGSFRGGGWRRVWKCWRRSRPSSAFPC